MSYKNLNSSKYFEEVVDCLKEAIILMNDVRTGDYKPDSFTTQPWEKALTDIGVKNFFVNEE